MVLKVKGKEVLKSKSGENVTIVARVMIKGKEYEAKAVAVIEPIMYKTSIEASAEKEKIIAGEINTLKAKPLQNQKIKWRFQ